MYFLMFQENYLKIFLNFPKNKKTKQISLLEVVTEIHEKHFVFTTD